MSEQIKCLRCGRILIDPKSIELGYGKICHLKVQITSPSNDAMIKILDRIRKLETNEPGQLNSAIIEDLLNRIRKIELDNNFMKYQLKHKAIAVNKNIEAIERIREDEYGPERDVFKVQFNIVIKELKIILDGETPILKEKRFTDDELGIKTPEEIFEIVSKKNNPPGKIAISKEEDREV